MYNLQNELIKSIIKSLKIDNNPFNTVAIKDMISGINNDDMQEFYTALFGDEHSYLNGLDRVSKVSKQFSKQEDSDNAITLKAKELITLCETLNTKIGDDAKRMGEDFDKLVRSVKLPSISDDDIAILNNIKPYYSHKELIIKIRLYPTSLEALRAFKTAIKKTEDGEVFAIENKVVNNLRIKR